MGGKKKGGISMSQVAFWTIVVVAVIFVINMILSLIPGLNWSLGVWLISIGALIAMIITAIIGWQYVRNSSIAWKLVYFICLALVIVCLFTYNIL